ncbi:MAG: TonB-dependent receptor, partial [candidate division Zixibacteria bacterium]|nr:TonB-dependent receptor [candidate division Zixibacteria bacterium]
QDTGAISFTTQDMSSYYVDFSGEVNSFTTKFSYTNGDQETVSSVSDAILFSMIDADIEYDLQLDRLTLRPGLSYKKAEYDWDLMGGKQKVQTTGFSLLADYNPEKYRLVAALRGDKYNAPDEIYPSYQFAAMYKINEDNLLRAVYSRANRAAFLASLYFNLDIPIPPAGIGMEFLGNEELDLMTMDMFELGYRTKIEANTQIDIEGFYAHTKDYNETYSTGETEMRDNLLYFIDQYQNIELKATQIGGTISVNYIPDAKLHARAFITVQRTDLKDHAPDLANPDSLIDQENESTPDFYGGFYLNYKPVAKLNLNANAYYYGRQTYDHEDYSISLPFPPFTTTEYIRNTDIDPKFIINLFASYKIMDNASLFLNARNALNPDTREFGYADRINGFYLAGLRYEY